MLALLSNSKTSALKTANTAVACNGAATAICCRFCFAFLCFPSWIFISFRFFVVFFFCFMFSYFWLRCGHFYGMMLPLWNAAAAEYRDKMAFSKKIKKEKNFGNFNSVTVLMYCHKAVLVSSLKSSQARYFHFYSKSALILSPLFIAISNYNFMVLFEIL